MGLERPGGLPMPSPSSVPDETCAKLVSAIGTNDFGPTLLALLESTCGADHCAALTFDQSATRRIIALSSDGSDSAYRSIELYIDRNYTARDKAILEARRSGCGSPPSFAIIDTDTIDDTEFRDVMYRRTNICQRALIATNALDQGFAISVLRTHRAGPFPQCAADWLQSHAGFLVACIRKHYEFQLALSRAVPDLSSLPEIEHVISSSSVRLPRRELQVAARTIYGVTQLGIALELGIGEESVATYRKRTLQRLRIATRHELLHWYLKLWQGHTNLG
ncbi:LuxR C-terminal-related transcriptional regulator [Sphingopyxis indica]|uniref:helix-turn-helix transcriptional regulator n=1 Tax=Sphingopyxis indica TaxID=436663 RepID=UPI002938EC1A|nr:LuxR C-terminal-related transcriptional regulator [Sphingopyxis indica]WOF42987.1 LuxR C-terminal-related transcriptional regulator [Sphingopyxis indica]